MSVFIKQIILNKMRQITAEDILQYSGEYGFTITRQQAEEIANYVHTKKINPFDKREREKMLHDLSEITDRQTALKADRLFHELIKSYGLEHLFN
ncbi:DUF2624 domain-containing protein [Ornithinibacillus sp. FSL M8-0202]|uniref:DUF2624 domain-containing protein n=1 Tax=Ornithinibacillus sp. FSL M8-0202 TaxID=2921616 RepID=UPI0030D0CF22